MKKIGLILLLGFIAAFFPEASNGELTLSQECAAYLTPTTKLEALVKNSVKGWKYLLRDFIQNLRKPKNMSYRMIGNLYGYDLLPKEFLANSSKYYLGSFTLHPLKKRLVLTWWDQEAVVSQVFEDVDVELLTKRFEKILSVFNEHPEKLENPKKLLVPYEKMLKDGRLFHVFGDRETAKWMVETGARPTRPGNVGRGMYSVTRDGIKAAKKYISNNSYSKGSGMSIVEMEIDPKAKILDIRSGMGGIFGPGGKIDERVVRAIQPDIIRYVWSSYDSAVDAAYLIKNPKVITNVRVFTP